MPTTFVELVDHLLGLIDGAIPVIFAVVFVFMAWKIIDSWVLNGGDESKREEGKQYAIVSVLVLVLMLIAWGVIAMLRRSLFGF